MELHPAVKLKAGCLSHTAYNVIEEFRNLFFHTALALALLEFSGFVLGLLFCARPEATVGDVTRAIDDMRAGPREAEHYER